MSTCVMSGLVRDDQGIAHVQAWWGWAQEQATFSLVGVMDSLRIKPLCTMSLGGSATTWMRGNVRRFMHQ